MVVFGHHRVEACKQLGLKTIRAYIRELSDSKAFVLAESENLQRNDDVNPVAEGEGFALLMKEGESQTAIAAKIQRSQQYVSIRIGLLRLEPENKELITRRLVTADHGYEISKVENDPKKRMVLAELSRKDRQDPLTVAELRVAAKKSLDELASTDPRVQAILMRDPMERFKMMESTNKRLDTSIAEITRNKEHSLQEWVIGRHRDIRSLELTVYNMVGMSICKREECEYYDGDTCAFIKFDSDPQIPLLLLRKISEKEWRIRVGCQPEVCSACTCFMKCSNPNRKLKESKVTEEDIKTLTTPDTTQQDIL
jgi:ParB-like chromosome segregation protein Spo0J